MLEKFLNRLSRRSSQSKRPPRATEADREPSSEADILARFAEIDASEDNPQWLLPTKFFEIPLGDLSESVSIAAIDFLTEAVRNRLTEIISTEHGYGNDFLIPVFVHPLAKISEHNFFEHVRTSCPGAIDSLRGLVTTYLNEVEKRGDPNFSQLYCNEGTCALSYALRALVMMDSSAIHLMKRWVLLHDMGHESYISSELVWEIYETYGWKQHDVVRFGIFYGIEEMRCDLILQGWNLIGTIKPTVSTMTLARIIVEEMQIHRELVPGSGMREFKHSRAPWFLKKLRPEDPYEVQVRRLVSCDPRFLFPALIALLADGRHLEEQARFLWQESGLGDAARTSMKPDQFAAMLAEADATANGTTEIVRERVERWNPNERAYEFVRFIREAEPCQDGYITAVGLALPPLGIADSYKSSGV